MGSLNLLGLPSDSCRVTAYLEVETDGHGGTAMNLPDGTEEGSAGINQLRYILAGLARR
jgi:hypothetical protein